MAAEAGIGHDGADVAIKADFRLGRYRGREKTEGDPKSCTHTLFVVISKPELQCEFDHTRRSCGCGDSPKTAANYGRVGQPEIHVIKHVEELRPELKLALFAEREIFIDADVGVPQARPAQRVDADGSESAESVHRIRARIEPL